MIVVRALGACEIQVGRKRITLTTEVPLALAFYLTMRAGESVTRDELAETFWGSKDPAKARHSLRQTLYKLRLKGFAIDEGAEEIRLDASEVASDVVRALGSEWPASATAAEVDAAQELLPGFSRRMAEGFTEWLDGLRSRVAAAHRRGALAQITRARREARWADLERWASQILRTDPLNEEATLARAESAAMGGSKAVALEILDAYLTEVGDNAPRIGLPATILRRRIAERQPEWTSRGSREVELVGRSDMMHRLTGFVEEAAQGRGGAVMLTGAPGVGKTRLAFEVRAFAELRGFRTLLVRADASHAARPLSTILTLLPLVLDLPGSAGASPTSLAVVNRALRTGGDEPLVPVAPGADAQNNSLASFRDLFRAVSEETRTLIVIDDVHNVDDASAEVLTQLIGSTSQARMLWILTSRGRSPRWDRQDTRRWIRGLTVESLSDDHSLALARLLAEAPVGQGLHLAPEAVARFSGGNPLFVRELSAHRPTPDAAVPMRLVELMQDRLSRFGREELQLIRTVALLGQLATAARVCRVLGASPRTLGAALEVLEAEGVIRLGPTQVLELHECWRSAVVDALRPSVRAALSLNCAQSLESEDGALSDVQRLWHAAELFADAGERDHARRLLARCAEQMMRLGVSSDAVPVLKRAQVLAIEPEDRLDLLVLLARAHYLSGQLEECVLTAAEAASIGTVPSGSAATASAVLNALLADSLLKLRRDHRPALLRLAEVAAAPGVPHSARLFACLFGIRVVFNDAQSALEDEFRRTALEVSALAGPSLMGLLVELVWTTERGTASAILDVVQQIDGVPQQEEPLNVRSMALRYQALALRWTGRFAGAIERAVRAFDLARAAGLQDEMGLASELLSFMHLDLEDFAGAQSWMKQWQAVDSLIAYPARTHALLHARARFEIQQGRPEQSLALLRDRLVLISTDPLAKRRIADLAIVALAAARVGDALQADQAMGIALEFIEKQPAAAFLDFPAEMTARALAARGESARAASFASRYLSARARRLPEGLPPCCSALRAIANATATSPAALS